MWKLHYMCILFVLLLIKVLEADSRPRIIPDLKEMVINSGEKLEISCINNQEIKFFYPETESNKSVKTSEHEILLMNNANLTIMQWTFRRNVTVYGDTGWYGCADSTSRISFKEHSHPNASWIFVYVKSTTSAFVANDTSGEKLITAVNGTVIIPCATTSPDLKVRLLRQINQEKFNSIQIISFDPKVGFLVNVSSMKHLENFVCQSDINGLYSNVSYKVSIMNSFKRSKISMESKQRVKVGSDLNVYCAFETNDDEYTNCHWKYPAASSITRYIKPFKNRGRPNVSEIMCNLYIRKVTLSDMGVYACVMTSRSSVTSVDTYIHVTNYKTYEHEVLEGKNVNMSCIAPQYCGNLTWINEYMQPLEESKKYIIDYGSNYTSANGFNNISLTINNIEKSDITTFICQGSTRNSSCNLVYNDLVVRTPMPPTFTEVNLNGTETYVENPLSPDVPVLICFVEGLPKPIISWYKNNEEIKEGVFNNSIQGTELKLKEYIFKQHLFDFNNQSLFIKYFSQSSKENYSCIAKNLYGQIQAFQVFTFKANNWLMIWISSTILLIILIAIIFIFIIIKIQQTKARKKYLREAGLLYFEEGAASHLNPNLMIQNQVELLPYNKKWEFTKGRLKLGEKLGNGAFGVVMKADAYGIQRKEEVTPVAVKIVHSTAEAYQVRALACELKIMIYLGQHLNIVNLLGACTSNIAKRELLIILEYCQFGNLHDYLIEKRADFVNQIDSTTGNINYSTDKTMSNALTISTTNSMTTSSCLGTCPLVDEITFSNLDRNLQDHESNNEDENHDQNIKTRPICTQDLLSWSFQVSRGMEYLSQKKILHGDLNAKNILLTQNNVVKICDFGLSKLLYKDYNYIKKGDCLLPIKWMSIESIRDRFFSIESDVWSFGVVLWEFFTLAQLPYPEIEDDRLLQKLLDGYRMEKPKYATTEIYNLMLHCWKEKPDLRPPFTLLVQKTGNILEESVKKYYMELSTPYEEMAALNQKYKDNYFMNTL